MNSNELYPVEDVHRLVWDFRRKYHEYWPTPNPKTCGWYCISELGEVFDALARQSYPGHARNSVRETYVVLELADLLMMLVSIHKDMPKPIEDYMPVRANSFESIAFWVADAVAFDDFESWWNAVNLTAAKIIELKKNVLEVVNARLESIFEKHIESKYYEC